MLDHSYDNISLNVCNIIYFSNLDEKFYYSVIEKISFIKEIKGKNTWDYYILDYNKINYEELEFLIIILSRYNVNIKNIINLIKIIKISKDEIKWLLKTVKILQNNNDVSFCNVEISKKKI